MNPPIVKSLKLSDPCYPDALKIIDQPPKQLFYRGLDFCEWTGRHRVAVVGSRKASAYGKLVTQKITAELVSEGVIIVSGLALGIDSIAHRAALDAGGCTIAVLPTPVERVYPASHHELARQIVEAGGAIISEYPSDAEVYRVNFIARNRIVSGLSDILLITEAAVNSGTLHTARFALEQGKTVMVVPGNINQPGSEGCNNLIKAGALPVTETDDIFFALGLSRASPNDKAKNLNLSPTEHILLGLIGGGIKDQEELAAASQLDGAQIGSALTGLEIAGAVRPEGAGRWTVA